MSRLFVNEVFYSLQGEGMRAGCPSVFVRFGKCNLACRSETHGFDCDTEFESGRLIEREDLLTEIATTGGPCRWVVLTGGEPALQLDSALVDQFHAAGYKIAIETNGSLALPDEIDWITVSPKVAEHAIRQSTANEVKYVRGYGQGIPHTAVSAEHHLISPAFDGSDLDARTLDWCIQLVKDNPEWRLSCQQHKWWTIR